MAVRIHVKTLWVVGFHLSSLLNLDQ